jgi:hypothetical protein
VAAGGCEREDPIVVAQVFISHSSRDGKVARTICSALESRGLPCWIASRDVGPGENFMEAIVQAIGAAKVMVLVFSENANNSDEIKRELVIAGNAKVTVIPVRVEDVAPKGAFAYQLATRQWIDLFEDWENQVERLAKWIAAIVLAEIAPGAATSRAEAKSEVQKLKTDTRAIEADRRREDAETKLCVEQEAQRKNEAEAQRIPEVRRQDTETKRRADEAQRRQRPTPLIRTFTGHSARVVSVAFSPDGRTALSGSWDKTLKLWEVATGKELRTFTGHSDHVLSVAFSPDGRTALSGSTFDDTLKLWEVATGKELHTFMGHSDFVFSVAFSPDGHTALSGSGFDDTLKLWEVGTGKELRTFTGYSATGYSARVASVAFSSDGRTALSGSHYKTLKLWEVATGKELRTFTGHSGNVNSVAFAPDGRTALSSSDDNTLKLWDLTGL